MSASASRSSLPVVLNVTWARALAAIESAAAVVPIMVACNRIGGSPPPRPGTAPAASRVEKARPTPHPNAKLTRPQRLPVTRSRALTVAERHTPIHDHGANADRILERILERRLVGNGGGIEHHEVGREVPSDATAVAEPNARRRERGHLVHRLLERQRFALAHVAAEHARERPEAARVGAPAARRAVDREATTVAADHA